MPDEPFHGQFYEEHRLSNVEHRSVVRVHLSEDAYGVLADSHLRCVTGEQSVLSYWSEAGHDAEAAQRSFDKTLRVEKVEALAGGLRPAAFPRPPEHRAQHGPLVRQIRLNGQVLESHFEDA